MQLEDFLIANGYNWDGTVQGNKIAKSLAAGILWQTSETTGAIGNNMSSNNKSHFSALPGGNRWGGFGHVTNTGNWWTSTESSSSEALHRDLADYSEFVFHSNNAKYFGFSIRCVRDKFSVTTSPVSEITFESAVLGGKVTSDGIQEVTERGVVYGSSPNPTVEGSKVATGNGVGAISAKVTGLQNNTTYYYRAYAATSEGIVYGSELSFITYLGEIADIEGNKYFTIQVGDQVWMAENLAWLPSVSPSQEGSETDPYYYVYDYQGTDVAAAKLTDNYKTYGVLYNWPAAMEACPSGWHLPSDSEWTQLENYLIANGYNFDGSTSDNKIAKSLAANSDWILSHETGTIGNSLADNNKSGFSAMPGGDRDDGHGGFSRIGSDGGWWSNSSSQPFFRNLVYNIVSLGSNRHNNAFGFSIRCVRDEFSVTTSSVSEFTFESAVLGGKVTSDGIQAVTERGVVYGISPSPTVEGSKVASGNGVGAISAKVTGLQNNTTYYYRAYAATSEGIVYGSELSFITYLGEIADIEGNKYFTIQVGDQVWMAENLAWLPSVSPSQEGSETDPYYYVYDYQGTDVAAAKLTDNYKTYGVLYNWPAAMEACPSGWHLPSDSEWTQLENYLIANGYNYDGTTTGNKIAKSLAASINWNTDSGTGVIGNNLSLNNKSGFTSLPGGFRDFSSGTFNTVGDLGFWWSITEYASSYAWYRTLLYFTAYMFRSNTDKAPGFSVRCVRDN